MHRHRLLVEDPHRRERCSALVLAGDAHARGAAGHTVAERLVLEGAAGVEPTERAVRAAHQDGVAGAVESDAQHDVVLVRADPVAVRHLPLELAVMRREHPDPHTVVDVGTSSDVGARDEHVASGDGNAGWPV